MSDQQDASEHGDPLRQFGDELAGSLRREFEQLRAEAGESARAGARGAALLAAAGIAGALAAGAALTVPLLLLRRFLPPSAIALMVSAGAGGVAGFLAKRGLDELGLRTDAVAGSVKQAAQDAVSSTR